MVHPVTPRLFSRKFFNFVRPILNAFPDLGYIGVGQHSVSNLVALAVRNLAIFFVLPPLQQFIHRHLGCGLWHIFPTYVNIIQDAAPAVPVPVLVPADVFHPELPLFRVFFTQNVETVRSALHVDSESAHGTARSLRPCRIEFPVCILSAFAQPV